MKKYIQVIINSSEDLPKENRDYIVHSKTFGWIGMANWKSFENENYPEYNQYLWLLNYDWYLIEEPEQSSSEELSIDKFMNKIDFTQFNSYWDAVIFGIKSVINGDIK